MIYGPLPKFCIERLREQLNKAGFEPEVFTADDLLEKVQADVRDRQPSTHPTYRNQIDSLHIEIPDEHLPLVKEELERMGIASVDPHFDPGFDEAEKESAPQAQRPALEPAVKNASLIPIGLGAVIIYFLIRYFSGN